MVLRGGHLFSPPPLFYWAGALFPSPMVPRGRPLPPFPPCPLPPPCAPAFPSRIPLRGIYTPRAYPLSNASALAFAAPVECHSEPTPLPQIIPNPHLRPTPVIPNPRFLRMRDLLLTVDRGL